MISADGVTKPVEQFRSMAALGWIIGGGVTCRSAVAKGLNAISWQRPSGSAGRASGLDELHYLDWTVCHHASKRYLGMASRVVVRRPYFFGTAKRTDCSVHQLDRFAEQVDYII
jgi:hypothetical protein